MSKRGRPRKQVDEAAVIAAYQSGKTLERVGLEYDISSALVRRILLEMGVKFRLRGTRNRDINEIRNARMLQMYVQEGETLDNIGKFFKVTRERVRQVLKYFYGVKGREVQASRRDKRIEEQDREYKALVARKGKPCIVCGTKFYKTGNQVLNGHPWPWLTCSGECGKKYRSSPYVYRRLGGLLSLSQVGHRGSSDHTGKRRRTRSKKDDRLYTPTPGSRGEKALAELLARGVKNPKI